MPTDKPSLPLIEHEFVPGRKHGQACPAGNDHCHYNIGKVMVYVPCLAFRSAHRGEPPSAEPWMPNANPWNGARTAAGANAAVEPSRESVPVGGADIVTVESHVHLLRRFATGLAEAIHAQRARDSEIRRERDKEIAAFLRREADVPVNAFVDGHALLLAAVRQLADRIEARNGK